MNHMGKMTLTAAALAAMAAFAPVSAAPAVSPAVSGINQAADGVQQIQYRRHGGWRGGHGYRRHGGWGGRHHYRRRGYGGWGWGAAGLATGLLLSSPYWAGDYADAEPYSGGYAYGGDGFARCRATFRSFDPGSGTYMGYDGVRRRCPYI